MARSPLLFPSEVTGAVGLESMYPEPLSQDDYGFVVLHGNHGLLPEAERKSFLLDILVQADDSLDMFRSVWTRMNMALEAFYKLSQTGKTPFWAVWEFGKFYESKAAPDREKFAAWIGDCLVGALNVRPNYHSAYVEGERILYLEHLATSPGNISTPIWERTYKAIGPALLAYSVLLSWNRGFGGRVGLHVGDDNAYVFYRSIERKLGFDLFHPEDKTGVAGTPEDKRAVIRPYFETIPKNALRFLNGYRHA